MRHRPLVRRSTIALSILAIVAVPALTGCWSGKAATTSMQATMNTGDGTQAQIGHIKILDTTLVMGDAGSDAMLIGTFANVGVDSDAVNSIEVDGKQVTAVPSFGELTAGSSVPFGYVDATIKVPVSGLNGPVSTYVPVSFQFQNAGNITLQVLTVPAVGQYEGLVPLTATPTAAASTMPAMTDMPSAEPTTATN